MPELDPTPHHEIDTPPVRTETHDTNVERDAPEAGAPVAGSQSASVPSLSLTVPDAVDFLGAIDVQAQVTAGAEPERPATGAMAGIERVGGEPAGVSVLLDFGGTEVRVVGGNFESGDGGFRATLPGGRGRVDGRVRSLARGPVEVRATLQGDDGQAIGQAQTASVTVAEPSVEWSAEVVRRVNTSEVVSIDDGAYSMLLRDAELSPASSDGLVVKAALTSVDHEGLESIEHGITAYGAGVGDVVSPELHWPGDDGPERVIEVVGRGAYHANISWGLDTELGDGRTAGPELKGDVYAPISAGREVDLEGKSGDALQELIDGSMSAGLALDSIGEFLARRESITIALQAIDDAEQRQEAAQASQSVLMSLSTALTAVANATNPVGLGLTALTAGLDLYQSGLGNAVKGYGGMSESPAAVLKGVHTTLSTTSSQLVTAADGLSALESVVGGTPEQGPSATALLKQSMDAVTSTIDVLANSHVSLSLQDIHANLAMGNQAMLSFTDLFIAMGDEYSYVASDLVEEYAATLTLADTKRTSLQQQVDQASALWKGFTATRSGSLGAGQGARRLFDTIARWRDEKSPYFDQLRVSMNERQKTVNFTGETSLEFVSGGRYRLGHAYELTRDTQGDVGASLEIVGDSSGVLEGLRGLIDEGSISEERDSIELDLNTAHAVLELGVARNVVNEARVEIRIKGDLPFAASPEASRLEGMTDWERSQNFVDFHSYHLRRFNRIFRVDHRSPLTGLMGGNADFTSVGGDGYDAAGQGQRVTVDKDVLMESPQHSADLVCDEAAERRLIERASNAEQRGTY